MAANINDVNKRPYEIPNRNMAKFGGQTGMSDLSQFNKTLQSAGVVNEAAQVAAADTTSMISKMAN